MCRLFCFSWNSVVVYGFFFFRSLFHQSAAAAAVIMVEYVEETIFSVVYCYCCVVYLQINERSQVVVRIISTSTFFTRTFKSISSSFRAIVWFFLYYYYYMFYTLVFLLVFFFIFFSRFIHLEDAVFACLLVYSPAFFKSLMVRFELVLLSRWDRLKGRTQWNYLFGKC